MYQLSEERLEHLKGLENKIMYCFNEKSVLNTAFMHSSYVNEQKDTKIQSNERLEFLGDSVLSLVISDYLFNKFHDLPEGELTKLRAIIVCEASLASVSRRINLGEYLLLGKGEEFTGGRERTSILADLFEALLAAIYSDGGFQNAKEFALANLTYVINDALEGKLFWDYKTHLQEELQKNSIAEIGYKVVSSKGPDHNKTFVVEVSNLGKLLGVGQGKSKKDAEQEAAKNALVELDNKNE
ncbi:MAG: ribonuclease III [Tissierellales bacterium]|jgi:ribonuclease-3|nr:ribonuclease III [Tissierellales bacterium]